MTQADASALAVSYLVSLDAGGGLPAQIVSSAACSHLAPFCTGDVSEACPHWRCEFTYSAGTGFFESVRFRVFVGEEAHLDMALEACFRAPHGCRVEVSADEARAWLRVDPTTETLWLRWHHSKKEFVWEVAHHEPGRDDWLADPRSVSVHRRSRGGRSRH